MVTKDDIRLLIAYFDLRSHHKYCLHEIAYRPIIRARFLQMAHQILGDVPAKEIIGRLLSLRKPCRCE